MSEKHRLYLPFEDKDEWNRIESLLRRPLESPSALDALISEFHVNTTKQTCTFFATVTAEEEQQKENRNTSKFDWPSFWTHGVPFMIKVALEMPMLFEGVELPLLLKGDHKSVTLSRRQCACLLAHSFFGSITANARRVETKKWAFRASQLFFLQSMPSALCFLNYFKVLGQHGVPSGSVTFERICFPRGSPPWKWEENDTPLCPVEFLDNGAIERSPAEFHTIFSNRFIGGGCLENDFAMEEILFVIKPELIVSMALCSHMVDEDVIRIAGPLQFSSYTGYSHTFEFDGDFPFAATEANPATLCAMDALQGCAKIQFQEGLLRRDLNKARLAFTGGARVATGNWGCGAFGNDHLLKFLQQWLAASDASVGKLLYHTYGNKKTNGFAELAASLQKCTVGELFARVLAAASECTQPAPGNSAKFRRLIEESAARC